MSKKPIGANDQMILSIGYYRHEGLFTNAMEKLVNKEMQQNLLKQLGCTDPRLIEINSKRFIEFFSYLSLILAVVEKKRTSWESSGSTTIVESRDATGLKKAALALGYTSLVQICNNWMGIDENDGIDKRVLK